MSKTASDPTILSADDFAEVVEMLKAEQLPTEDLTPQLMRQFLGLRANDRLIGVVGLELHADVGLLRSLAVRPEHQRKGLGRRLATAMEAHSKTLGAIRLALLTQTAESFLPALATDGRTGRGFPQRCGAVPNSFPFALRQPPAWSKISHQFQQMHKPRLPTSTAAIS